MLREWNGGMDDHPHTQPWRVVALSPAGENLVPLLGNGYRRVM